jgi:hypothetical protein
MPDKITAAKAVRHGLLTVNGAVMLLMFGPPALVGGLFWLFGRSDLGGLAACIVVVPSWICAWLAWSILTPRWRVWAYQRVDNIDELKARAVEAGVIWPDGHFFERTEIRSAEQRRRILEIEDAYRRR